MNNYNTLLVLLVRRLRLFFLTLLLASCCHSVEAMTERDYLFGQAMNLIWRHHFHQALPLLDRVINIDAGFAEAYYQRGRLFLEIDEHAKAKPDLDRAIRINHSFHDAYESRARWFLEDGKRQEAIQDLTEAIRLDPKNADLYKTRSKIYVMLNQDDKALADSSRGLELEPTNWTMWDNRARIYFRKGLYQKCVNDLNQAMKCMKARDDIGEILAARAKAYDRLGQKNLAEEDRKKLQHSTRDDWGFLLNQK